MRLVFRNQFLFSAHVHTKNFRNAYGSVCIQVVLQECDQHTRRSNYGVVQGMCQVFLSVLAVDTDFQTSCLCITKVGAASYLEVFLLTRRPCLNIDRFYFQVSQVTGAALQSTNRDIHGTEQVYGVLPQFVIPHHAVFRFADNNHLLFLELMDTVYTTLFNTMSTFFLTEARRIAGQRERQFGFRQDLVQAFTYLPKLCSHIHFPMQSGSDRILKMMRRPYRNETYLDLCARMKQARPDLSITTDIIVGFPGETEEDYLLTRQAVERVQFDNAFIFRYSPRRGTPAAAMEEQIPEEVKEARNQDLLAVANEIAIRKNRELVGTVQEVLLEGPSKTNEARLSGRTSQNKPVMVDAAPDLTGELLPIRIEESTGFTLYGVPCPSRG